MGMFGGRPRIQSAHGAFLPDGSVAEIDGLGMRPTKSAANKYRQMIEGNAIVEEVDY